MRSTRNQPFCWQEKKILRFIREKYSGVELVKFRNLYLSITEIDSDFNNKDIKFYTKTISKYSGLSTDWIPKGLKKLQEFGIIKIIEDKEKGKFKGKKINFTPENIKKCPKKPFPVNPLTVNPLTVKEGTSEDILLLEDIPYKENNEIGDYNRKVKHLEYVYLSQKEYNTLISKFDEKTINKYIDNLNNYIGSKGKKYKSHYFTLLNWLRKDNIKEKPPQKVCSVCGTQIGNDLYCKKCDMYLTSDKVKYAS